MTMTSCGGLCTHRPSSGLPKFSIAALSPYGHAAMRYGHGSPAALHAAVNNIRETLMRQHAVYRHDQYRPVMLAANEEENTVFQVRSGTHAVNAAALGGL